MKQPKKKVEEKQMKIKFPEKLIESFAKYYALQIEMG